MDAKTKTCPACRHDALEFCGPEMAMCRNCCGMTVFEEDDDEWAELEEPAKPVSRAEVAEMIHEEVRALLGVK